MNKLFDAISLLNQGKMVANPEFWKKAQAEGQPILAGILIGIVALLKGTDYEIQIPDETLALIAGGIFAAINWMLTRITTEKDVSVLPVRQSITAIVSKVKPKPTVSAKQEPIVQPEPIVPDATATGQPTDPSRIDKSSGEPRDIYFG